MKVLGSDQVTIKHIITDVFDIGEKIAVVEGRENCPSKRSIQVFRYIVDIFDDEFITCDEKICSLTLSALPIDLY